MSFTGSYTEVEPNLKTPEPLLTCLSMHGKQQFEGFPSSSDWIIGAFAVIGQL